MKKRTKTNLKTQKTAKKDYDDPHAEFMFSEHVCTNMIRTYVHTSCCQCHEHDVLSCPSPFAHRQFDLSFSFYSFPDYLPVVHLSLPLPLSFSPSFSLSIHIPISWHNNIVTVMMPLASTWHHHSAWHCHYFIFFVSMFQPKKHFCQLYINAHT